jgi:hypothetical protein
MQYIWGISFEVLVAFRWWPSLAETCKGFILSLKHCSTWWNSILIVLICKERLKILVFHLSVPLSHFFSSRECCLCCIRMQMKRRSAECRKVMWTKKENQKERVDRSIPSPGWKVAGKWERLLHWGILCLLCERVCIIVMTLTVTSSLQSY